MVDAVCKETRTETVVDVDDTDAAGAGIQHGQQRGDAAEGCAVTDRSRDCDDRAV